MPRNRNLAGMEALYVGPTGGNTTSSDIPEQIFRVQNVNRDFTINRTDVRQFGQHGALDKLQTAPPTVNLSFEYLVNNFYNESNLGFVIDNTASAISGFLNTGVASQKNFYLLKVLEGVDANGLATGTYFVEGIGNGFISNYTARGAVGGFATAALSVEGLNWRVYNTMSGNAVAGNVSPAIDPSNGQEVVTNLFGLPAAATGQGGSEVTAIGQGDITVTVSGTLGLLVSDLKIQNYELTVPLTREEQNKLGSKFAFARNVTFPIDATMSVTADVGDMSTGSLHLLLCNDPSVNCRVAMLRPACPTSSQHLLYYEIRQAKLGGQSFTTDLNGNEQVTINWISSIGNSAATNAGIYMSGYTL